ncbi:MAG: phosphatase PAP2 family protein [Saezia sp.]
MPSQKQLLFLLFGGTLWLVLPPLLVFISGWQWQPFAETPFYLYPLYLLTETGTVPWAFLTCVVFAGIPMLYLKLPLKKAMLCFIIMMAYLGAGQIIKETLKNIYEEPRPYVSWLETQRYIPADEFYAKTRTERGAFILEQDFSKYSIPAWQQKHWGKETGFSFPSGHTIFAAQWLLIYLLLLWRRRGFLPIACMGVWATGMEVSRMVLGMHWASDVFVSCLLAAVLIYPAYLCWRKWSID